MHRWEKFSHSEHLKVVSTHQKMSSQHKVRHTFISQNNLFTYPIPVICHFGVDPRFVGSTTTYTPTG